MICNVIWEEGALYRDDSEKELSSRNLFPRKNMDFIQDFFLQPHICRTFFCYYPGLPSKLDTSVDKYTDIRE